VHPKLQEHESEQQRSASQSQKVDEPTKTHVVILGNFGQGAEEAASASPVSLAAEDLSESIEPSEIESSVKQQTKPVSMKSKRKPAKSPESMTFESNPMPKKKKRLGRTPKDLQAYMDESQA